jgi:DNA-binding winged helix-turn-helix (wHTH) protein
MGAPRRSTELYEFGPFLLDASQRVLFRAGERIPLTSKAFDTLLTLLRNPGRIVEKYDLISAVWPDTVVEENNLNQNISVLRKVLGEGQDGKPYIETVPRRGVLFRCQCQDSACGRDKG